jgi:hypothetical protein
MTDQIDGVRARRGEYVFDSGAVRGQHLRQRHVGPVHGRPEADVHDDGLAALFAYLLGQVPDLGALRIAHADADDRRPRHLSSTFTPRTSVMSNSVDRGLHCAWFPRRADVGPLGGLVEH